MLDFEIMKTIMEELSKGLENFYNYLKSINLQNLGYLERIKFSENIKSLIESGILTDEIMFTSCGAYPNQKFHLTQKGIKILSEIRNGNINSIKDLYDFNNSNIAIENKPVFNNNPNIDVSPTFNNINNISSENNNIINIKDLIDLVGFIKDNSSIDDNTKQEIINIIKEIEKVKDKKDFKSYVDLYSKLLTSLQATLNISPFIIQGFEWLKNLF